MNIPDEAIEAAAKRYYEASHYGDKWQNLGNSAQAMERGWIRRALEAAAPHLLTQMAEPGSAMREAMGIAWEEGYSAHQSDGWDYQTGNPYKEI